METIQAPSFGEDHQFTKDRWKQLEDIIRSGKVARFHYQQGFYKDVNSLELDTSASIIGDLTSFRRTGGQTPFVCWESFILTVEAVDP